MTSEQLRKVQLTQLELLCEVRRICEKEGIKYNIIAGTLLGAVRHKGFIPWDDDADVAMLRPEYEKFRNACEKHMDKDEFYFQDHRITPGYRWGYGKLRRVGTAFVRNGQEHMPYEQGIFIDIFPLDNVPETTWRRRLHNLHCNLIRKILWSEVGKIVDNNRIMRILYTALAKIPLNYVHSHYNNFAVKHNSTQSRWVRILTFPTPNKEHGYLRKWYETPVEHIFENEPFFGTQHSDEYFTFKFGNWRELPPENKRKTHPVSRLRLREDEKR